jgi:hypothetical protein
VRVSRGTFSASWLKVAGILLAIGLLAGVAHSSRADDEVRLTRPPASRPQAADDQPAVFTGRCKRGRLPDYRCTPGTVFKHVTAAEVCRLGYSKSVRNVSESLKQKVYLSYGIRRHRPYEYEVDHLISLELGGNNSQRNLWPEKQPGARSKDKIENALHRQLCQGTLSLRAAESAIKHWSHVRSAGE